MKNEISKKTNSLDDRIKQSGHLLHLRVFETLRKILGGDSFSNILVSPYFLDGVSDKPREIDLYLKRQITRDLNSRYLLRFFIECKYLPKEKFTIFLEEKIPDIESHLSRRLSVTPFDSLKNLRYSDFIKNKKIGILGEPFKELFEGVDTVLKASEFEGRNGQTVVDFLFVVVGGNQTDKEGMFVLEEKPDKKTTGSVFKPVEYELFLVNYFAKQNNYMGSRQVLVEFVHELKFEEVLRDVIEELESAGYLL